MQLSIIVPMLNEEAALPMFLEYLQPFLKCGCEILLVDGGSSDASAALAQRAGFSVFHSPRGRARQMNAGARLASGDVLLFLHADTRLPAAAMAQMEQALSGQSSTWGRFDVQIEGKPCMLRAIAFFMSLRSRVTGICTGDQAIFVRRGAFEMVGGFPDQSLMEDVALCGRLRRLGFPVCLKGPAITSGRRWETRGVWRTILLMWRLRFSYWRGVSPETLAKDYR